MWSPLLISSQYVLIRSDDLLKLLDGNSLMQFCYSKITLKASMRILSYK